MGDGFDVGPVARGNWEMVKVQELGEGDSERPGEPIERCESRLLGAALNAADALESDPGQRAHLNLGQTLLCPEVAQALPQPSSDVAEVGVGRRMFSSCVAWGHCGP